MAPVASLAAVTVLPPPGGPTSMIGFAPRSRLAFTAARASGAKRNWRSRAAASVGGDIGPVVVDDLVEQAVDDADGRPVIVQRAQHRRDAGAGRELGRRLGQVVAGVDVSPSTAAVTRTWPSRVAAVDDTMTALSPISRRTRSMAWAIVGAEKVLRRMSDRPRYSWPTVLMRAFGWISFCDITMVWAGSAR